MMLSVATHANTRMTGILALGCIVQSLSITSKVYGNVPVFNTSIQGKDYETIYCWIYCNDVITNMVTSGAFMCTSHSHVFPRGCCT